MFSSRGLLYPWIEPIPSALLMNYILYWDQVGTLVPECIEKPYIYNTSLLLADKGWLVPVRISENDPSIEAAEKAIEFLRHIPAGTPEPDFINPAYQRPYPSPRIVLSTEVGVGKTRTNILRDILDPKERQLRISQDFSPDWINIPSSLAILYLTELCAQVAKAKRMPLLASQPELADWLNSAYLHLQENTKESSGEPDTTYASAGLVELAMSAVTINESTPIKKVIRFREKHQAELDRYRGSIQELAAKLTAEANSQEDVDILLREAYVNTIRPAVAELRKARKSARIASGPDILKAVSFGISPGILAAAAGHPLISTISTATGIVVSGVISAIKVRSEGQAALIGEPFSFIVAAERTFSRDSSRRILRI